METEPAEAKDQFELPGVPECLEVSGVSRDAMTISWEEPERDGGATITGYVLERKSRRSRKWTKATDELITGTQYRIRGLKEGHEYMFRVAAVNAAGQGQFTEPTEPEIARVPICK